ncbi:MAG: metal-dependent hydrolase [Vicinamibacterales bacterium]
MDNICHTLVGAACGEAGLKQRTRYGNATLMIAANLPDIDVLSFLTDTAPISFRRGWTHGILAQLLLPIAFTGVMYAIGRLLARRRAARESGRHGDRPPLHAGWLLLLSYIGVSSHVFLDFLNNYGVRLLSPFDWRWFYGDAVFIADVWMWLALGVGVWLTRRQRRWGPSRAALAFVSCYIAAMLVSAQAARAVVADTWREVSGTAPRALMVGPLPFTPFTRVVIIDAGDRYETGVFRWWPTGVGFDDEATMKNAGHPLVQKARVEPQIREFLVWARFPFWTITPEKGGTRVTVGDVRFMSRSIRRANFQASTLIRDP